MSYVLAAVQAKGFTSMLKPQTSQIVEAGGFTKEHRGQAQASSGNAGADPCKKQPVSYIWSYI